MKKCANKYEPVTFGYDEVCLRFVTNTKPFTEAEVSFFLLIKSELTFLKKLCEDDGANLVHIKNEESQKAFNAWFGPTSTDWYNENPDKENTGAWIGLTDLNSDPRKPQMEWLFEWGSSPSYQNYLFGQPEQTQTVWPGNSCGFIKESSGQNWDVEVGFALNVRL